MFCGEFLVPSYYKDFKCKGNDCRKCCCGGWAVTVSMNEYFKMLSLDCSKELKNKIDISLHVLKDADVDRYAQLLPNFRGECPLRLDNGYCGLQCECGEEQIPAACRYYPREPRLYPQKECCISNSCEWVIEELIKDNKDISFEKMNLQFFFDDDEQNKTIVDEFNLRNKCLDIVSDQSKTVMGRIKTIFELSGSEIPDYDFIIKYSRRLKEEFEDYASIREYCAQISEYDFKKNLENVYKIYPKFDKWTANILVNHLYYMKYPFVENKATLKEEGMALLGVMCLWVILLSNAGKTINDFSDITSEMFRVVEHTRFYKNAMIIADNI